MQIYKTKAPIALRRSWFLSLITTLLITIGVLILMQGLGLMLVPPIFNISLDEMLAMFTSPANYPEAKLALFFVQGLGSGLAFILAALIIAKLVDKADFRAKQQIKRFKFKGLLILIFIMLGAILFNSLIIDWNANIHLPESLGKIEEFFKETENQRMEMTKFLTDFDSHFEFAIGILVIGLLAGFGEEFFFRGVIQPKMQIYTRNGHLAVWLTAFIFSAIHIQFYGFFPRMLLGAVFGYLYLYSGSLVYPIIAHILNNSFTLILIYMGKLGKIEFDIEQTQQVSLPYAIVGFVVFILAMKIFKDYSKTYLPDEELEKSL